MAREKNSQRLDLALVHKGLVESRAQAAEAIKGGLVLRNGAIASKPSLMVAASDNILIAREEEKFVSRAGAKLAAALAVFPVHTEGKVCLDLGASTGGFTDVLLRGKAKRVYAVDVGYGQLIQKLRDDPRVVNLEKTHAKALDSAMVPELLDLVVCDVSFISLKKALPFALSLANAEAEVISLIKPQFELGPAAIGKGGIVSAPKHDIDKLINGMVQWFIEQGWKPMGVMDSPISGKDGNREYLIAASRQ